MSKQQFKALDDSLDLYVRKTFEMARRKAIARTGNHHDVTITVGDMRQATAAIIG